MTKDQQAIDLIEEAKKLIEAGSYQHASEKLYSASIIISMKALGDPSKAFSPSIRL